MNKIQEIKMQLLHEFASYDEPKSVDFCREAYKFLTEEGQIKVPDNAKPKDGIYIVFCDDSYVEYSPYVLLSKPVSDIGVIYEGHAFRVAPDDLDEWPLVRDTDKCPEESPFYKTECEGLHDWDFISATEHIKEVGTDIPLPEGWYIPTLAVLEVMCFLKEQINEALEFIGGKPMPDVVHWSSTEYGRGNARYVGFGGGGAYNSSKYSGLVVRAVTAFNI